jgi:hypothetical protein
MNLTTSFLSMRKGKGNRFLYVTALDSTPTTTPTNVAPPKPKTHMHHGQKQRVEAAVEFY